MTIENKLIGEYTDKEFNEHSSAIEDYVVENFLSALTAIHDTVLAGVCKKALSEDNNDIMTEYLDYFKALDRIQMHTNDPDTISDELTSIIIMVGEYLCYLAGLNIKLDYNDTAELYNCAGQASAYIVRELTRMGVTS